MDHLSASQVFGPREGPVTAEADPVDQQIASFEEFFGRERDRLFGLLALVTGDRHEAEELAQEAFVIAWERWDSIHSLENPVGYLHRIAINAFRKRYRRAQILRRLVGGQTDRATSAAADASLMLEEALRMLAPRQRAALVLTELLGYTASEAARMLGVKESTIGALKYQGRTALRRESEATDE